MPKGQSVISENSCTLPSYRRLIPEQFQTEGDYYRATVILEKMLSKGLITEAEFHKID